MPDILADSLAAAESAIIETATDFGHDDIVCGSSRDFARAALEAATPLLAETTGEVLCAALRSITSRITTSAMDFSDYEPNAWVYGIAVGWDCDEDHGHDDICGGTAAMEELAARFGWDEAAVARLRGYRRAYAAATEELAALAPSAPPAGTGEDEGP